MFLELLKCTSIFTSEGFDLVNKEFSKKWNHVYSCSHSDLGFENVHFGGPRVRSGFQKSQSWRFGFKKTQMGPWGRPFVFVIFSFIFDFETIQIPRCRWWVWLTSYTKLHVWLQKYGRCKHRKRLYSSVCELAYIMWCAW